MIRILGISLIVLGALALAYQGFTYTVTKQDAHIGSLQIQHDETKTVPVSPILAGIGIVGGIVLLGVGSRRSN